MGRDIVLKGSRDCLHGPYSVYTGAQGGKRTFEHEGGVPRP